MWRMRARNAADSRRIWSAIASPWAWATSKEFCNFWWRTEASSSILALAAAISAESSGRTSEEKHFLVEQRLVVPWWEECTKAQITINAHKLERARRLRAVVEAICMSTELKENKSMGNLRNSNHLSAWCLRSHFESVAYSPMVSFGFLILLKKNLTLKHRQCAYTVPKTYNVA